MLTLTKLSGKYKFSKDNVDLAPNTKGVYALYEGNELIYYGRAKGGNTTIRSRLQAHFSGHEGSCTKIGTSYTRQEVENPEK